MEERIPNETGVLVRRARGGDDAALSALLERYQPRVVRIVRRRIGSELRTRMESGDVVQETMVEVLRSFSSFEPRSDRSFLRWIAGVVENRIRNLARRNGHAVALRPELVEDESANAAAAARREEDRRERELLSEGLARLSDAHRCVIALRNDEHLSFRDIGLRLGKSEDAAFMLHKRAKARLTRVVLELRKKH